MRRRFPFFFLAFTALAAYFVRSALAANGEVLVLTVEGPITQATSAYIERGLAEAERREAEAVVVRLNTPGGQIDVMEKIVRAFRASRVPVIVFVTPRGALAGSAGAVITIAGHAAAMSPETAIGAASPVGGQGEDLNETLDTKIKEAMSATARSLTERRGPEATALAEAMIQDARAVSASEAKEAGLIDFIAADTRDLLRQAEELTVLVGEERRVLRTAQAVQVEFPMSPIEELLNILTNPNLIAVLLLVGTQAILIELSSPGGWFAGFVGVVCLALAFYGLSVLPVNWFGLVFIVTAFVLFILDIKAPTHGGLTIAATASLIAGVLVLFNSGEALPFQRVSVPLVVGTAIVMAGLFFAVVMLAVRAQKRPVTTGVEALLGQVGDVRAPGLAQVAGELWSVEAEGETLEPGQKVEVVGVQGLRLRVKRKK